jgi:hypothetical protein
MPQERNMSRSRKKTNAGGCTTAPSERDDKNIWHKMFRRKNRVALKKADKEETVFVIEKEVSDPWQMDKDGKTFYTWEEGRRK